MAIGAFDQIQSKYATEKEWLQNDPILGLGEWVYVVDKNMVKFGNGVDPFSQRPYIEADIPEIKTNKYTSVVVGGMEKNTKIKSLDIISVLETILTPDIDSEVSISFKSTDDEKPLVYPNNQNDKNKYNSNVVVLPMEYSDLTITIPIWVTQFNKDISLYIDGSLTIENSQGVEKNDKQIEYVSEEDNGGYSSYSGTYNMSSTLLAEGANTISWTDDSGVITGGRKLYYLPAMYAGILHNDEYDVSTFINNNWLRLYHIKRDFMFDFDVPNDGTNLYHPYIMYPASFGELSAIYDDNGFNLIDSFTKLIYSDYTLESGINTSYIVYVLSDGVNDISTRLKFYFSDKDLYDEEV